MSELVLNQEEVIRSDITPLELQAVAEKKSAYILEKIIEQSKRIDAANEKARIAKNFKRSWWKSVLHSEPNKVDKVAEALVSTNDAVSGLSDLVQESVRFTCTSIQFAQIMHKSMAHMMVNGFIDSNGNLQKLAGSSQEFVEEILQAAEDFVSKQHAVEKKQAEIHDKFERQQNIDVEQFRRLEELQFLLAKHEAVNDSQEKALQLLFDYTKQKDQLDREQSTLIENLTEQQKIGRLALVFGVVSLVASFVALGAVFFQQIQSSLR